MTKTISLADDAYEALVLSKREGESFSDLARRLAAESARQDLWDMDLKLDMTSEDAARRKQAILDARRDPRNERL